MTSWRCLWRFLCARREYERWLGETIRRFVLHLCCSWSGGLFLAVGRWRPIVDIIVRGWKCRNLAQVLCSDIGLFRIYFRRSNPRFASVLDVVSVYLPWLLAVLLHWLHAALRDNRTVIVYRCCFGRFGTTKACFSVLLGSWFAFVREQDEHDQHYRNNTRSPDQQPYRFVVLCHPEVALWRGHLS